MRNLLKILKKQRNWNQKDSAYQNDVAYGLNNLGRFEEAIQYAEKALKLNPRSGVAYSNKGFALTLWENWMKPSNAMIKQ